MRKVGWSIAGALLLSALCVPGAFAQATNSCPQTATDVDFIARNTEGTALGALFDLDQDGATTDCGSTASCQAIAGVDEIEILADGVPDLMHLGVVAGLVQTGSEFYDASACATYQANYSAVFNAFDGAGLVALFGGGDEVVSGLVSINTDWAYLTEGLVKEYGFEVSLPPSLFTVIPELSATGDPDNDSLSLADEWTALGATFADDEWSLPGKTNEEVYAAYQTEALAGTSVVVTLSASGGTSIFIGGSTTINASSNAEPADSGFAFASGNEAVATVDAGGVVTGVSEGTATITVSADPSGATGTIDIDVVTPAWFDICTLDNVFAVQGGLLAAALGAEIGAPTDFNLWDLEGFVGDTVPDAYQVQHLAYILCTGGIESKDVDKASVVAEYQSNIAEVTAFFGQVAGIPADIDALAPELEAAGDDISVWGAAVLGGGSPATELNSLATIADNAVGAGLGAVLFDDGTPMLVNGGTFSATGPALTAAAGSGSDLDEIGGQLPLAAQIITALWGLSTEYKATIDGLFAQLGLYAGVVSPGESVEEVLLSLPTASDAVQAYGGILPAAAAGHAGAGPFAFLVGTMPETAAIAASLTGLTDAATYFGTNGTPAPLVKPDPIVYGTSAKLPGEPFAGNGDGNPNDALASNADVYAAVNGAGGDVNDYIAGVTGEFGPFWAGNPALPVGGALALSALIATLGAAVIRRKR